MAYCVKIVDNYSFEMELDLEKMILTAGINQQKRIFKQILKYPFENEKLISEMNYLFEQIREEWEEHPVRNLDKFILPTGLSYEVNCIEIGVKEWKLFDKSLATWVNIYGKCEKQ